MRRILSKWVEFVGCRGFPEVEGTEIIPGLFCPELCRSCRGFPEVEGTEIRPVHLCEIDVVRCRGFPEVEGTEIHMPAETKEGENPVAEDSPR